MVSSMKISDDEFVAAARAKAELCGRGLDEQILHWARIGRAIESSRNFDFSKIERVLSAKAATTTLSATEQSVWSDLFLAALEAPPSEDEIARFKASLNHEDAKGASHAESEE